MVSRRKARILAFQALYAWDISHGKSAGSQPAADCSSAGFFIDGWEELPDFTKLLISGTIENITAVDAMIRRHLENWDFSRLNKVDLAVLRMSAYALMYQSETAHSIIINEAVGISKEYGTDDSYRFINGVLDGIHKTLEAAGENGGKAAP